MVASFHFQIIPVVVASPCRATALPSASRLDRNDLETESLDAITFPKIAGGTHHLDVLYRIGSTFYEWNNVVVVQVF